MRGSDGELILTSTVKLNTLVWLRSLPEAELGPSERMLEDIRTLSGHLRFRLEVFDIGSADQAVELLRDFSNRAWQSGLRPIIHLDMHATAEDGLSFWPAGDRLGWNAFEDLLRDINIPTGNNLVCLLGTCFGLYAIKPIKIDRATPTYALIASEREVTTGFLEDKLPLFYKDLFTHLSIVEAFNDHLGSEMTLFHCEKMLVLAYARFLRRGVIGRNGDVRKEQLVSRLVASPRASKSELRRARSFVKERLRPDARHLAQIKSTFLLGRDGGVTVDDIASFVRDASKVIPPTPVSQTSIATSDNAGT